jgi:geranylgeranyl pyrophosphate synthase
MSNKMIEKSILIDSMKRIVNQRGKRALERAKTELCSSFPNDDPVSKAIRHFAECTLRGALPVFPALVSLSCEAVGGKLDKTTSLGVAIVLMAGAADVHDDVIDESPVKNGKQTVFGKFGKEVAILVGDVLLVRGVMLLQRECVSAPGEQGKKIMDLLAQAIFDISRAEAMEAQARARHDLSPKTYMAIIELKSVVPEFIMKTGAILGNGNAESVQKLSHYGKTYGIVSTIAEEFMDVLEPEELQNRLTNACPPLPCLSAFKDHSERARVLSAKDKLLTKEDLEEIKRIVLNSAESNRLKHDTSSLVRAELNLISTITKHKKTQKELETLLSASIDSFRELDS